MAVTCMQLAGSRVGHAMERPLAVEWHTSAPGRLRQLMSISGTSAIAGGAAARRRQATDRTRPKAEVGGCGKQTFELRGVNYFLD